MFNILKNTTIKTRIILIFSLITVMLVGLVARISYVFVRTVYLEQMEDHLNRMSTWLANDIKTDYLELIESDPENTAYHYYRNKLETFNASMQLNNAFLFNKDFEVLLKVNPDISASRLKINRTEISDISTGKTITSLPFKGEDNQWYLWGFYRINDQYYLGIQESANRLAKLDNLSLIFIAIAFSGILLTVGAAFFVARSVSRPIDKLVQFSSEIGHGNYNSDNPEGINGELSVLSNALSRMRDDISRHQEEKEKMLAQIAHEIRNPLGGIELLAGLIREHTEDGSQNAEYIEKIITEVQGLKTQVNEYLQFSRPVPAQIQDIYPDEIFTDIKRMLDNQLVENDLELIWSGNIGAVRFDPNHFRQIMTNLISNSIQMSPAGAKINVSAEKNGKYTTVAVSDTGPGIVEEDLKHIFEPFFSRRKQGIGLGLSICKKLAETNKAELRVKNNETTGCTFSLMITTN